MYRGGPAPKPTALRLIEGDRADRINPAEPIPRGLPPVCPDGVSDDVRAIWDYTVAELDAMGTAAAADRDALLCYCEAVVSHRRASAVLANSAVLVKGIHGGMVRNPALQIQRDSAGIIRAFAQEFGLTPSARTRIEVKGASDDGNPFAGTGT
ncbi:phage terminase small subunit P27 family [Kutzneria chonburiensis]|uniref:Phage terminase small subunit P27 family n=1 Tax=Kutzneria chonburiensis TaxID=1483604 RepID=A0ABV6N2U9_9PSEU|nr:phage terminase small subunit P27 family [Kutzneria chonburiensis]